MAISPQKYREILFLLLYSSEFGSEGEVVEILMAQLSVTKKVVREALVHREKISAKVAEIDLLIQQHSQSYALERIPFVERTVLRLAIYELLYAQELPRKVVISEAIRLAKKFATVEAAHFVNAILDSGIHVPAGQVP